LKETAITIGNAERIERTVLYVTLKTNTTKTQKSSELLVTMMLNKEFAKENTLKT